MERFELLEAIGEVNILGRQCWWKVEGGISDCQVPGPDFYSQLKKMIAVLSLCLDTGNVEK